MGRASPVFGSLPVTAPGRGSPLTIRRRAKGCLPCLFVAGLCGTAAIAVVMGAFVRIEPGGTALMDRASRSQLVQEGATELARRRDGAMRVPLRSHRGVMHAMGVAAMESGPRPLVKAPAEMVAASPSVTAATTTIAPATATTTTTTTTTVTTTTTTTVDRNSNSNATGPGRGNGFRCVTMEVTSAPAHVLAIPSLMAAGAGGCRVLLHLGGVRQCVCSRRRRLLTHSRVHQVQGGVGHLVARRDGQLPCLCRGLSLYRWRVR